MCRAGKSPSPHNLAEAEKARIAYRPVLNKKSRDMRVRYSNTYYSRILEVQVIDLEIAGEVEIEVGSDIVAQLLQHLTKTQLLSLSK